jgi:Ca-activated chloride channel family protein
MPDMLSIRTALDKEFRPAKGDFLQTLMIELSPGRGMRTLPLNLGILLDVSSSMQGPKLENAKKACILLLQQLTLKDRATVCTFSSGAQTVVPPQLFDESVQVASCKAVESLRVSGATELLAGLEQVYQEITPHQSAEVTSYVILLSDGEPTDSQGYIDDQYSKFIDRAGTEFEKSGVSLSTIGLGSATDFNAGFLRDLADKASGKFLMASRPEDLESTFQEEFGRIRSTVISEATIEINRLNGAVRRFWRVVPDKKMFDAPKDNNGTITLPVGAVQLDQPQA